MTEAEYGVYQRVCVHPPESLQYYENLTFWPDDMLIKTYPKSEPTQAPIHGPTPGQSQAPTQPLTQGPTLAPTQQITANKLKEENASLKCRIRFLEDKIKDMENEREFLRSSLTSALSAKKDVQTHSSVLKTATDDTDSSDGELRQKQKKKAPSKKQSKATSDEKNSPSCSSPTSSTSSSPCTSRFSSPHKTKKSKKKNSKNKNIEKGRRVFLPEQAIARYKKVLAYIEGGATKTLAYYKCGVDRKTIVDTASIAELEACDVDAYKRLRSTYVKGQKLSKFADRCRELCEKEPLQGLVKEKKKKGLLIDINKKYK